MERPEHSIRPVRLATLIVAVLALLTGCGGGTDEDDLPDGDDFQDSPLQISIAPPAGSIVFLWPEDESATSYRLFEDADGTDDFQPFADNIPADENFYIYEYEFFDVKWKTAVYRLEACMDDLCELVGFQDLRGAEIFSVGVFGPPSSSFNELFGASTKLSQDGNTLIVGAPGSSDFVCEELVGVPEEDLPDLEVFPACGYVIPTDPEGDPDNPDDDFVPPVSLIETQFAAGSVYVFTREDLAWSQTAFLTAPNREAGDNFGWQVALSADGKTLAVAAPREDSASVGVGGSQDDVDNEALESGAVYVYTLEVCTEIFGIPEEDLADIAIFPECSYVIPTDTEGDPDTTDDDFVPPESLDQWVLQAYVKATNTEEQDLFGWAIALAGDGDSLAVSSILEEGSGIGGDQSNNDLERAGAVYTYRRSEGVWAPQDYLKPIGLEADDIFGISLSLNADGEYLAVGALEEGELLPNDGRFRVCNPSNTAGPGAVYIFNRVGESWTESTRLNASNAGRADCFGFSVDFNEDASRLAVGAPTEDSDSTGVNGSAGNNDKTNSGAAYVFERVGSQWSQSDYFKASNTGTPDLFGTAVALSDTGDALVVGAIGEAGPARDINGVQDFNTAPGSGAAYGFIIEDGDWKQIAYIKSPFNQFGANFGWSVDIAADGNKLAVGAPGWELSNSGYLGVVYVF